MSIYQLPLGQYGYLGHVINLPQDVLSFASTLPRLFSELSVLIVKKGSEQSHQNFRVHRFVVQEALTWLLQNLLFAALAPNGACVTLVFYIQNLNF